MKLFSFAACTLLASGMLSGCMPADATGIDPEQIEFIQCDEIQEGAQIAVIDTTLGEIKLELFEDEAPNTVQHFKKLVNDGFYNNKPIILEGEINTIISGYTDEYGKEGALATENGKKLEAEVTPNLWHFSGSVSAWGETSSRFSSTILQDSRFFILGTIPADAEMVSQMEEYKYPQKVIDQYKTYGGLPNFTGTYTVFGQIYEGLDVVDEILTMPIIRSNAESTDESGDDEYTGAATIDGVVINSITISTYSE